MCLALSCVLKAGFVKVGVLGVRPAIDLVFVDIALCGCFLVVCVCDVLCVGGCVTLLSA